MIKILTSAIFAIGFSSCATMKNFDRPLPASESEGIFHATSDGTKIFVHTRLPAGDVSASIYVLSGITGINHNSEKDIIEALSGGKNRVVVIHPRGTGYSEGKRGDIKDFSKFLEDYAEIINNDVLSGKYGGKVVLFGHSMSTAVVLHVAEKISSIDGAILVNPPFKMKPAKGMSPSFGEYFKYAFYYAFAPHKPVVNMAGNPALIKDEAERMEAEARGRDPLLVKYFSLYYMNKSRKMMAAMVKKAKKADYPLLLIYGNKDGIVEKSGCDEIFAAWKNPNKQYVIVENGPHGKLTVLKAIAQFKKNYLCELGVEMCR
jgi:alpha-beta hydrolase superfamily lysophospholipase